MRAPFHPERTEIMSMRYRAPAIGAFVFGAVAVILFVVAAIFGRDDDSSIVGTLANAVVPVLHVVGWSAVVVCALCVLAGVVAVVRGAQRARRL